MGEGSIRAFVAVETALEVVAALTRFQEELRANLPGPAVRWARADQLHLTLKFLGNVAVERLEALKAAVTGACAGMPAIRLAAEGLGAFPSVQSPRVIWVGLHGESERLKELQHRIDVATVGYGDPAEERGFHPHLTLGRVANRARGRQRAIAATLQNNPPGLLGEWSAREVHLVRSQLLPTGAVHTHLLTVPLARDA